MSDEESQHLVNLLHTYQRRLRPLERQAAQFGARTDPQILNEIEDIKDEILRIENKLELIKIRSTKNASLEVPTISPIQKTTLTDILRARWKLFGILILILCITFAWINPNLRYFLGLDRHATSSLELLATNTVPEPTTISLAIPATSILSSPTSSALEKEPTSDLSSDTMTPSLTFTPEADSKIFFQEDFTKPRNDGLGLVTKSSAALTTTLENNKFIIKVNSPGEIRGIGFNPGKRFKDFDMKIHFSTIESNDYITFSVGFRIFEKYSPSIYMFLLGDRKGEYYVQRSRGETDNPDLQFLSFEDLQIVCRSQTCRFYLNDSPEAFATYDDFPTIAGNMQLKVSGVGIIVIDKITVQEL